MVVETGYVAGDGVLLGSGEHWLLVTDPGDEEVVGALWTALGRTAGAGRTVAEQVLAILEKAFDGDPPALAYVDLAPGSATSVARGRGHVRVVGEARILSLDAGRDPQVVAPTRRLVGGVVAAERAEIRPVARRRTLSPAGAPAPERPAAGFIDGVPQAILDAIGPTGPPPPRPRLRPDPAPVSHTVEPDTIEPEPTDTDVARRLSGGSHLRGATDDSVLAVHCPQGHPTPPESPYCRTCHQPVAPQEPQQVRRPTLGGLRLPSGEVVPLDRDVVLGRKPAPVPGTPGWPHLVHLPPDHAYVSRMHLQIELDGWHVVARDLDSRGGTVLRAPGREPQRMRAHERYVLEPGWSLDLAEAYEVRFEIGPVVDR